MFVGNNVSKILLSNNNVKACFIISSVICCCFCLCILRVFEYCSYSNSYRLDSLGLYETPREGYVPANVFIVNSS
ncbi:hypothetical protein QVD17_05127 [Tagetes erecta]|uniref:Uncharacterized protein n=1 Tax=Tagetes erecta TaxID=13708 RepID=A0AAD8LHL0_TARER|nr:hypothetical protein QVD17_05127 [Tagetes erecta]